MKASEELLRIVSTYVKENKSIKISLGEIINLEQIGQGGNGIVYKGELHNEVIAIKFLTTTETKKNIRFKAEYFNVNLLKPNNNIVKYINFEELNICENIIPIILMKKYNYHLKKYRENLKQPSFKEFIKLFNFLTKTIKFIHSNGIIHRDIKPENILVSEDNDNINFILADFGIAHYNEQYLLKAETKSGDRLANYSFSAPEQFEKGATPKETMDIYALGQICQWFVFNKVHKGTKRELFASLYTEEDYANLYDSIIDKCIANEAAERFQSIEEIEDFIKMNSSQKFKMKKNPFDIMMIFNENLRKSFPTSYRNPLYITDINKIKYLIDNINSNILDMELWFNTGMYNNVISRFEILDNLIISDTCEIEIKDNVLLLNHDEFLLKGIWVYCGDNLYDDYLILDVDSLNRIKIGEDTVGAYCIVNDNKIIKAELADSGYFLDNNIPVKITKFDYRFRNKVKNNKYYFVAPRFNNFIFSENDRAIYAIQSSNLTENIIHELQKKIFYSRHPEVDENL